MLHKIRDKEYLYRIPLFDLNKSDIENLSERLSEFHANFQDCFYRVELKRHFYRYMAGQLSSLERKSIEPIALSVEGGNVRAMQRFISDAEWSDEKIERRYHEMVREEMGSPDGAVIFGESVFVKKGSKSIGVAWQYCENVGKVENSQVGVFAAYASSSGYVLIDKELYLPEKWFGDAYHERRKRCNLPEEAGFRTKPEIAASMLVKIKKDGIIPFRYVLADSVYGSSSDFISSIEAIDDIIYFVSIEPETRCRLDSSAALKNQYGNIRKSVNKDAIQNKTGIPVSVRMVAESTDERFWQRSTVSEGTKGAVEYEFTKYRIILNQHGVPSISVWLIIRRSLSKSPAYSYYISNAPLNSDLKLFVWLSGMRWAIKQCFEETKGELGMGHYEVRKFKGWHHHIMVCMLAHFFLWQMKIRFGEKSSICYHIQDQNSDGSDSAVKAAGCYHTVRDCSLDK